MAASRDGNLHAKHRERMRERVLRDGIDGLADHEALEFFLFGAKPRGDTNELSHKLINRFGSLAGVFDADYGTLLQTEGIGPITAAHLYAFTGLYRKYHRSRAKGGNLLDSVVKLGNYLHGYFKGRTYETAYLLTLDARHCDLLCVELAKGSFNKVEISPKKVIDIISRRQCKYAVLAHNHTSDIAIASADDIETTMRIREILHCCGVELRDHLIFEENDFMSMRESFEYSYIFTKQFTLEGRRD